MEIYLPQAVRAVVGDQEYSLNGVGMSDSEVLVFPEHVLKIQPHSAETDNESAVVRWLGGRLPAPEIPVYMVEDGTAYTLMTRVPGEMLCAGEYMASPALAVKLAADALKALWSVDFSGCPDGVSRLTARLREAEYNVRHGLVDMENVEPETFGEGGFGSPKELLQWLCDNRPPEDIVFTHGDLSLPNVFAQGDEISGFIDLGKAGPADRWQDIAICLRSLHHNFAGAYNNGAAYPGYDPQMLFDALGIEPDAEKIRYYILLDELF